MEEEISEEEHQEQDIDEYYYYKQMNTTRTVPNTTNPNTPTITIPTNTNISTIPTNTIINTNNNNNSIPNIGNYYLNVPTSAPPLPPPTVPASNSENNIPFSNPNLTGTESQETYKWEIDKVFSEVCSYE